MSLTKQQFENLEIWKLSIEIAEHLCRIAERLENMQMNKFSEYMRDICMRISNNIAEISDHITEEHRNQNLAKSHLLILEEENIIMILYEQQLVDTSTKDFLLKIIHILDDKILDCQQKSDEIYI